MHCPTREDLPTLLNSLGLCGCGVEVGVQEGRFSAHILERWHGKRLISVDPWETQDADAYQDIANVSQTRHDLYYRRTMARLSRYGERSSIWRTTSEEAAGRVSAASLDFVYLDARHDYESVVADLELWRPALRPGAVFAGHDYLDGTFPKVGEFGVKAAVDEFFARATHRPRHTRRQAVHILDGGDAEAVTPHAGSQRTPVGIGWQLSMLTGWGVYGMNLSLQLEARGRLVPVPLVKPLMQGAFSPLHRVAIAPIVSRFQDVAAALDSGGKRVQCPYPVLHATGDNLERLRATEHVSGTANIAMTFFEDSSVDADGLRQAGRYDLIVAGSTWNEAVLTRHGVPNVRKVLQGIDPSVFHPAPRAGVFGDRFVVFSGGKLEYRKGQDIVVEAFRRFHARHPDALLLAAWQDVYRRGEFPGLDLSGYVHGAPEPDETGGLAVAEWLRRNGLPDGSFVDLGAFTNYFGAGVVREADVALFPNRCEGGTNLVAMECMACGVPTILSANTGHLDLVAEDRCFPLVAQPPAAAPVPGRSVEGWGESDVAEIVDTLEVTYADREEASHRGRAAAAFMRDWTWSKQTDRLLEALDGAFPTQGS